MVQLQLSIKIQNAVQNYKPAVSLFLVLGFFFEKKINTRIKKINTRILIIFLKNNTEGFQKYGP